MYGFYLDVDLGNLERRERDSEGEREEGREGGDSKGFWILFGYLMIWKNYC